MATAQAAAAKLLAGTDAAMLVARDLGAAGALAAVVELAVHLPCHPQQQQPADEDQPDDLEQLGDDQREQHAQHERGEHADQDDLLALLGRQGPRPARRRRSHCPPPARDRSSDTWRNAAKAAGSVMLAKSWTIAAHMSAGEPRPPAAGTAASSRSIIWSGPRWSLVRAMHGTRKCIPAPASKPTRMKRAGFAGSAIGSCWRRNPRSTWRPSSCRAGTASRRSCPSA